jgi:hypothetical protein
MNPNPNVTLVQILGGTDSESLQEISNASAAMFKALVKVGAYGVDYDYTLFVDFFNNLSTLSDGAIRKKAAMESALESRGSPVVTDPESFIRNFPGEAGVAYVPLCTLPRQCAQPAAFPCTPPTHDSTTIPPPPRLVRSKRYDDDMLQCRENLDEVFAALESDDDL